MSKERRGNSGQLSPSGEWRAADAPTIRPTIVSNDLFNKVISVLGLDVAAFAIILSNVLKAIGSNPADVTIEEIADSYPEIERRLRQIVPPEAATAALKRLQHYLLDPT